MECKIAEIKEYCPCTNTVCPRHGKCCECVAAHKTGAYPPACLRHFTEEKK